MCISHRKLEVLERENKAHCVLFFILAIPPEFDGWLVVSLGVLDRVESLLLLVVVVLSMTSGRVCRLNGEAGGGVGCRRMGSFVADCLGWQGQPPGKRISLRVMVVCRTSRRPRVRLMMAWSVSGNSFSYKGGSSCGIFEVVENWWKRNLGKSWLMVMLT